MRGNVERRFVGRIGWELAWISLGLGAMAMALPAQTLTTLYNFCSISGCPDGAGPYAALVQGSDGSLYGTTGFGGLYPLALCDQGCGTIFKVTLSGALTTLHSFDWSDGEQPSGLVQGTNGEFYGTTFGGANGSAAGGGDGTIFAISASGTMTTLHSFCSLAGCTDGGNPTTGLVQATDGDLYGTTSNSPNGYGTIFKITTSGALATLYEFAPTSGARMGMAPRGCSKGRMGTSMARRAGVGLTVTAQSSKSRPQAR